MVHPLLLGQDAELGCEVDPLRPAHEGVGGGDRQGEALEEGEERGANDAGLWSKGEGKKSSWHFSSRKEAGG